MCVLWSCVHSMTIPAAPKTFSVSIDKNSASDITYTAAVATTTINAKWVHTIVHTRRRRQRLTAHTRAVSWVYDKTFGWFSGCQFFSLQFEIGTYASSIGIGNRAAIAFKFVLRFVIEVSDDAEKVICKHVLIMKISDFCGTTYNHYWSENIDFDWNYW